MKSTGIVRQVDPLGRVVLPKELRKELGINEKDGVEIYVDGETIVLKKHQTGCIFCGVVTDQTAKGKKVCPKCAEFVANLYKIAQ